MSCRSLAQSTTVLFVNNPVNLVDFEYSKNAENEIVYMGLLLLKDRKLLTNSTICFLLHLKFNLSKAAKKPHNKTVQLSAVQLQENCSSEDQMATISFITYAYRCMTNIISLTELGCQWLLRSAVPDASTSTMI